MKVFEKKLQKNLVEWKKSTTFALAFKNKALRKLKVVWKSKAFG